LCVKYIITQIVFSLPISGIELAIIGQHFAIAVEQTSINRTYCHALMDRKFNRHSKHAVHAVFGLILCGLSGLLFQLPALAAQSVVLAWMPSSSTNIVGYKIYYGTESLNYNDVVAVGNTNAVTISGLMDGTTYYFAAIAVDSTGEESPFSNEAVYTVLSAAATLTVSPELAGGFSFSVSGISGYQYVVQSSTDMVNWVPVQTNTAPFTFTDMNASEMPQCFYRTFCLSP
jgi:hypothetical protein